MKPLSKILIFFTIVFCSFSQGFDWQYSARLPSTSPNFFSGLNASFSYLLHNGNIDFTEKQNLCCNFNQGSGIGTSYGISGEYWYSGIVAFNFIISYNPTTANFSIQSEPLPRPNGFFISEYRYETKLAYLNFEPGVKYRISLTHFHVGASAQVSFLMQNDSKYYESVLEPKNWPWRERIISEGKISELNSILIIPKINIGYDFTFALTMYATAYLSLGIPIMNITNSTEWRTWRFSAGLSIFRGLFYLK